MTAVLLVALAACSSHELKPGPESGAWDDSAPPKDTDDSVPVDDTDSSRGTDSGDTGIEEPPCVSTMDARDTLTLCGRAEGAYAGWSFGVLLGDTDPVRLVTGALGLAEVYVATLAGPGERVLQAADDIRVIEQYQYDPGFGLVVAASAATEGAHVAAGAESASWFEDGAGRVYVYDVADGGVDEPEPAAVVNGDHYGQSIGWALALSESGEGVVDLAIGRNQAGGRGGYPSAYVFRDVIGRDALVSDADLVVVVEDYEVTLGEHVAFADVTGDGSAEALISAERYWDSGYGLGGVLLVDGEEGMVSPSELDGVWDGTEGSFYGRSFDAGDITGDGYQDLVLMWDGLNPEDPPCSGAIVEGPIAGNPTVADSTDGFSILSSGTSCSWSVAVGDTLSVDTVSIALGTGSSVLRHLGPVHGWLDEEDFESLAQEGDDDHLGYYQVLVEDVDGDGINEVIAGAESRGEDDVGAAYIFW